MFGKRSSLFFGISIGVLVFAILMAAWGFPRIISKQIQKNIQIDNSSAMFEKWRKTPIPLTFKIYVFNVTNTEEINKGEKPKLAEIGPFVYKEYREKTILGYGSNDTIRYMLKKTFVFNQEESGGLSEDEEITVINFSYMAAILTVQEMMPGLVGMINTALEQFFPNLTDPFLRVKARDLFFEGIYLNCNGDNSALNLICGKIKSDKQSSMRPAEDGSGFYFSMFNHLNESASGPYEMIRGTENVYDLGHIVSYKDQSSIKKWGDSYCGQINGSDSSIFPPIDEDNVPARIYSFEPDICRSLYVDLVGKRILFDITAYYYEISETALAAKSANPNNKCFCRRNWSANHDGCLLMGVLNLAPCQGAPAVISLPHFYLGSEELLEYFSEGVSPDAQKHNTHLYLDPKTGVVLEGARRLQFNIELRQLSSAPQLHNVQTGLFPLLWIEEGATLPESLQDELRQSHKLLKYVEVIRWVLLSLAIVAAIICGLAVARAKSLLVWPRSSHSVSFIHRTDAGVNLNKVAQ